MASVDWGIINDRKIRQKVEMIRNVRDIVEGTVAKVKSYPDGIKKNTFVTLWVIRKVRKLFCTSTTAKIITGNILKRCSPR